MSPPKLGRGGRGETAIPARPVHLSGFPYRTNCNAMIETQKSKKSKSPLKELREKAGVSQQKASELIGVTEKQIRRWESLEARPSMENVAHLARLYGTSLRDIFIACGIDVQGIAGDHWRV